MVLPAPFLQQLMSIKTFITVFLIHIFNCILPSLYILISWRECLFLFNLNVSLVTQYLAHCWCWIKVAKWINRWNKPALTWRGEKGKRPNKTFQDQKIINFRWRELMAQCAAHTLELSKGESGWQSSSSHLIWHLYLLFLRLFWCFLSGYSFCFSLTHGLVNLLQIFDSCCPASLPNAWVSLNLLSGFNHSWYNLSIFFGVHNII